jgi:hypothetical protein
MGVCKKTRLRLDSCQISFIDENGAEHNLYKPANYIYNDSDRNYLNLITVRFVINGRCVRNKGPRSLLFNLDGSIHKAFWGKKLSNTITKEYYSDLSVRRLHVNKYGKERWYHYTKGAVFDNINFYRKQALQYEAEVKERLGLK